MKLLNDEQVRQFIVDGALVLQPDVDPELHERINQKLRFSMEQEFHPGNNVLARVPEIWTVLRAPNIRGALTSLLGPNYYVHPHRAIHSSHPVEDKEATFEPSHNGPPMGKGSRAGSGWHQDAQSPLSRARHHTPKYLIAFYFPHDTPEVMGPTRYQAGSYLFSEPHEPTGVVLPAGHKAGTFVLLHFDMIHAAWPNRTDLTRYMIKIVFSRTETPVVPTWFNVDEQWQQPDNVRAEVDLSPAWHYIWSWLHGQPKTERCASFSAENLNSLNEETRLRSVYTRFTDSEIQTLAEQIKALSGSELHNRRKAKRDDGSEIPRDHVIGKERRWNERAIVYDDAAYALAACGEPAIDPLLSLVRHADPWVRMNAVFALGEIGPAARRALPDLCELLEDKHQQVVRQTLDAIASIGDAMDNALDRIDSLLTNTNDAWQTAEVMRGWTGENQVRLNAVFALLSGINYDNDLDKIESILTNTLDDPNGYVPAVAVEALTRIGTTSSHATAIRFLQDRRWDDTLMGNLKPF